MHNRRNSLKRPEKAGFLHKKEKAGIPGYTVTIIYEIGGLSRKTREVPPFVGALDEKTPMI